MLTVKQPLEASRTHPYHYRAYNLAAMIVSCLFYLFIICEFNMFFFWKTNARIAAYTGDSSVWNRTTTQGATIQTALDFAMTIPASESNEEDGELYSIVSDVAAIYGDPQGKYIAYLKSGKPTYAIDASFLWDQPLPGGEKESAEIGKNATSGGGGGGGGSVTTNNAFSGSVAMSCESSFSVMVIVLLLL
jgi:hypothetical protein